MQFERFDRAGRLFRPVWVLAVAVAFLLSGMVVVVWLSAALFWWLV